VSRPTPTDRLADLLAHLPDGCRAILAAVERAGARGGGDVLIRLEIGKAGEVEALELPNRYIRADA
jgi:hypothetical protein